MNIQSRKFFNQFQNQLNFKKRNLMNIKLFLNLILKKLLIIFIIWNSFVFIIFFRDYYLVFYENKNICTFTNSKIKDINQICYGIVRNKKDLGFHVWGLKENLIIDKACPNCSYKYYFGCLDIVDNKYQIELKNDFISFYLFYFILYNIFNE